MNIVTQYEIREYETAHGIDRTQLATTRTPHIQGIHLEPRMLLSGVGTSTNLIYITAAENKLVDVPTRLAGIKELANLTDTELAEILLTSRQTIHNWRAGKAISAKREHHIEEVFKALSALCGDNPDENRRALLASDHHGISCFDLFVQNRAHDVYQLATNGNADIGLIPKSEPVSTQFARLEDMRIDEHPQVDENLSGKL